MKVLLDTCVWGGVRTELAEAGHDVIWTGDWSRDPGDDEILAYAFREGRVLITLDKDFGELVIVYGRSHTGIVRLVNLRARQQGSVCLKILETYHRELTNGAIITADEYRVRIRGERA